jgi:large subunit ribosomal protein L23
MKDLYSIIKSPYLTEKAMALKDVGDKLVFEVDKKANKIEIKNAFEKFFKVKVKDVNTYILKGKQKRVGRFIGFRSDVKKAVITLHPGEKFEYVEGV